MTRDEIIAAYEQTLTEHAEAKAAHLAAHTAYAHFTQIDTLKLLAPYKQRFLEEHKNEFWGETAAKLGYEAWLAQQEGAMRIAEQEHALATAVNQAQMYESSLGQRLTFYASQLHNA